MSMESRFEKVNLAEVTIDGFIPWSKGDYACIYYHDRDEVSGFSLETIVVGKVTEIIPTTLRDTYDPHQILLENVYWKRNGIFLGEPKKQREGFIPFPTEFIKLIKGETVSFHYPILSWYTK